MTAHELDKALRAAAKPVASRAGTPSAEAMLDSIVRSAPAVRSSSIAPPRSGRRTAAARPAGRRPLRLTLAAVALTATAAVAAVVGPNLTGGGNPAWASWTPTPVALPTAEAAAIVDACVSQTPYPLAEARAGQVVGERRGEYSYLGIVTPAWTMTCFRDRDGAVSDVSEMVDPVTAAALGYRGVELTGWSQLRTGEGFARVMAGRIGSGVVSVDISVRGESDRTVHATVQNGMFLAWYPEGAAESNTSTTLVTPRLVDGTTVDGLHAGDLHDNGPYLG